MKTGISSGLLAHYAQGTTTLCVCWKVARTDGVVFGFTDLDHDLVIDGVKYEARSGVTPTDFQAESRLAVDNLEVAGFLDSDNIVPSDLLAGLWDFARVEIFLVNWQDLTQGIDILMTGHIGAVSQKNQTFTAELRGLANAYAQTIGEVFQPGCRATLGDARCGVSMGPYSVTGTLAGVSSSGLVLSDPARTEAGPTGAKAITGITQATLPVVTSAAHGFALGSIVYIVGVVGMTDLNGQFYEVKTVPTADSYTLAAVDTTAFNAYVSGGTATPQGDAGYFAFGKITMTSGASKGLSMEVKAYGPGTITLQLQFPLGVAVGDTYSLVAGCAGRFNEDCVTRFSNGINFRGEPFLPGMDKVLRIGTKT